MFNSHPKEGEAPSFKGSALMIVAEDEQQARLLLEEDVYSKSGVWDLENTQIIPVCFAVLSCLNDLFKCSDLWNPSLNPLCELGCDI